MRNESRSRNLAGRLSAGLRLVVGLILWGALGFLVARAELAALGEQLAPRSAATFAASPRSVRSFSIRDVARPGPLPYVFRLKYPADWLGAAGVAGRPLAVFVDGRLASWLAEEPSFDRLDAERPYAYIRSREGLSFFVVCPPAKGCERVDLIRDDTSTRLSLAWESRRAAAPVAGRVVGEVALLALLVWWSLRTATADAVFGLLTPAGRMALRESVTGLGPRLRAGVVSQAYPLLGLGAVLAASFPLLFTRYSVPWDATDSYLLAFRWIGSCLREGAWCEYFPNVFSGYTVAGQPEFGFYNVFYLLIAFVFPDSVLSINVLYLALQCAELLACFRLGRQLGVEPIGRLSLALGVVASGFWVGHAEHFSYLSSALSATLIVSGLLDLSSGRHRPGGALVAMGSYMLGSAGYPALMVSNALVLVLLFFYELARSPQKGRMATWTVAAVTAGATAAAPALAHFWSSLERSSRLQGLSVEQVMAGSLPLYSLANFLLPSWHWPVSASATDISMDRFHLLHSTPWILAAAFILRRGRRATVAGPIALRAGFWAGLSAVLLILSLGSNSPLPLRRWLAESWMLFRMGRFPGAEYIFFVQLFAGILAAACVVEVADRLRLRSRTVAVALVVDFLIVMTANNHLRIQRTSAESRGTMPRFQVVYGPADRDLLQQPRDCPDTSSWSIDQRLAPHGFSWWGYSPLLPYDYVRDVKSMAWALCGGPRLWDVDRQRAIPFSLERYSPSDVSIRFDASAGGRRLLWAETADPFWTLSINGSPAQFEPGPAGLRYFGLPPGTSGSVHLEMVYRGPVTQLWRSPAPLSTP